MENLNEKEVQLDAVVIGAGFAGLYMLHLLRDKRNLNVKVLESADGVGGTWYWNRYPGARCDIPSYHYSYSFSDEIQQEWRWSEKYAAQPEILKYLEFVAEKLDLYPDINFSIRVDSAIFNEETNRWKVRSSDGSVYTAKYLVPAIGTLSTANIPIFKGQKDFEGETFFTGHWPKDGVDFNGKKVAVIGTGATAMQAIPLIAKDAEELTVFQRTPNYAAPLRNRPITDSEDRLIKSKYMKLRKDSWESFAGVPFPKLRNSALDDTNEDRIKHYEDLWDEGGFSLWIGSYQDLLFNKESNETAAEFVREKIREQINNPAVADILCPPKGQTYGTKRQPCETGYFETFNRDNVNIVDIKRSPIKELTKNGLSTADDQYEFDCLVYATGFDAFTGSFLKMDIRGRKGLKLKDYWSSGARTYLGLSINSFPNMFMITGPQSPSVLFNMPLGIEMHCEWIADCISNMEEEGFSTIEADKQSEDAWLLETKQLADATLLPDSTSWYLGANIPGKPRLFLVYLGGGKKYKDIITNVAMDDYRGFIRS